VFKLVPTFTPFFFHWNVGELPPLVGIAVNVVEFPEHINESGTEIETDGVMVELVSFIALLFAVTLAKHGVALDVNTA
jgi:hypothetical protein